MLFSGANPSPFLLHLLFFPFVVLTLSVSQIPPAVVDVKSRATRHGPAWCGPFLPTASCLYKIKLCVLVVTSEQGKSCTEKKEKNLREAR